MRDSPVIFWFRRDLRLSDQPALTAAAVRGAGRVAGLFVLDDRLLVGAGRTRVNYLRATLAALSASMGGALIVRRGDPATVLGELAVELGAPLVVATADFTPAGRRRDERVASHLGRRGVLFEVHDSPYVVAPGTLHTASGSPFRVFGAYARHWREIAHRADAPLAAPELEWVRALGLAPDEWRGWDEDRVPHYFADLGGLGPAPTPPAGEIAAKAQLELFAGRVENYSTTRDSPGVEGTSRLSPFLRLGALHPRTVLARTRGDVTGAFVTELAWREFYADVLYHHPDSRWRNLQPHLNDLPTDRDARAHDRFRQWALGVTGYPLVDAGMRQLLAEGWMHNRVRMVTASFLVKHLHLDWRWGARWFLWRLVDGDVASNQHGWQWTAGTGTDAAPFHRIFNPTRQAERFDPEGHYIRRYVSELADVTAPACRLPGGGEGLWRPRGYPAPIIDLDVERREALERYGAAREGARR